jgi:hypothetical protein
MAGSTNDKNKVAIVTRSTQGLGTLCGWWTRV